MAVIIPELSVEYIWPEEEEKLLQNKLCKLKD